MVGAVGEAAAEYRYLRSRGVRYGGVMPIIPTVDGFGATVDVSGPDAATTVVMLTTKQSTGALCELLHTASLRTVVIEADDRLTVAVGPVADHGHREVRPRRLVQRLRLQPCDLCAILYLWPQRRPRPATGS